MKVALLFSGGKDSTYAGYLVRGKGHELVCLLSVFSENPFSYMFHTPSISKVKVQAEVMKLPLLEKETKGEKEEELEDLKEVLVKAKEEYKVEGVVTGAVKSVYQSSRIQKICDEIGLEVFNPLWKKDELELLDELVEKKFKVILIAVAAHGLDKSWLGREIDSEFIEDIKKLNKEYQINPAGEGGEFETFVLDCPLFSRGLEVKDKKILEDEGNYRLEVDVR